MSTNPLPDDSNSQAAWSFPSTRWSLVAAAGRGESPEAPEALAALCRAYWYPLYAYARRRLASVDDAQDLTQEFFARLLEKDYLQSADPRRGKFRSFLLTAFKHFLAKEHERAAAQKRGGPAAGGEHSPHPLPARGAPSQAGPRADLDRKRAEQLAALDRVRRTLLPLAMSLLLTAAGGLVSTVVLGLVLTRQVDPAENAGPKRLVVAAAALLVPPCVGLIVIGAVQMLRLRSYRLCLAAALVAVLPWSPPSWLLGLTVGTWAVIVLGRREVMLAFLREGNGATPHAGGDPEPPGPVAGKLRSWWRSFARYFVTLPGTRASGRDPKRPIKNSD